MKTTTTYFELELTNDENDTVSNCIGLGFGTEKTKSILLEMRKNNIPYLGYRKLEFYR